MASLDPLSGGAGSGGGSGGGGASGRSNSAAAAPSTPARLSALLAAAVDALEREVPTMPDSSLQDMLLAIQATRAPLVDLERACGVAQGGAAAALAAGRVPLPSPSVEVKASFDALARLTAAGSIGALRVFIALAFKSPVRVAAMAQHRTLLRSLAGALDAHLESGAAASLVSAAIAAGDLLRESAWPECRAAWRDAASGGNLHALAASLAGALGAELLPGDGSAGAAARSDRTADALAWGVCVSGDPNRLRADMLAKPRFGDALCAALARAAATVPPVPAAGVGNGELSLHAGPLLLASALSGAELHLVFDPAGHHAGMRPRIAAIDASDLAAMRRRAAGAARTPAAKLAARAPALLERLVGVVEAGLPWYEAAAAELDGGRRRRSGAGGGGGSASVLAALEELYGKHLNGAMAALVTMAPQLAAAGYPLASRLAPAVTAAAEAGLMAARLGAATPAGLAPPVVALGSAAVALHLPAAVFEFAAVRGTAPAGLVGGAPVAAALLRLAGSESPQHAGRLSRDHSVLRLGALKLLHAAAQPAAAAGPPSPALEQIAAALRASPALIAGLGAAFAADPCERQAAAVDREGASLLADRRAAITTLLYSISADVGRRCGESGVAELLRPLAACRPLLEACDGALRTARPDERPPDAECAENDAFCARAVLDLLAQHAGPAGQRELCAAARVGALEAVAGVLREAGLEVAAAATPGVTAVARGPAAAAALQAASREPPRRADACAACGAAGAVLKCSGCKGARYCGPDCQKRDWPTHKVACRRQQRAAAAAAAAAPEQGQQ